MNHDIYKYEFSFDIPIHEVERLLALSVLTTESLHGRTQVRLDASFYLDKQKRACIVDAGTEVGRHIARIFTGYLTREFGEEAFKVKRIIRDSNKKPATMKQNVDDPDQSQEKEAEVCL